MGSPRQRWDNDTIGRGITDGSAFAPGVHRLLDEMAEPDWVAEDPDAHLLPHLRDACERANSPWTLVSTEFVDGVYTVNLEWSHPGPRLGILRSEAFALVGSIAEGVTYVHQHVSDDGVIFEVATGTLDGESPFRGHGHLLQLDVRGDATRIARHNANEGFSTHTSVTRSY